MSTSPGVLQTHVVPEISKVSGSSWILRLKALVQQHENYRSPNLVPSAVDRMYLVLPNRRTAALQDSDLVNSL